MVATYTWHSESDVEHPRWVRSVSLLPDEIISSWLVRAALAQGCDPMVLTGDMWPKWRIWTRDVDRFLNDEPLSKLVTVAGIPLSSFRAATLKGVAERVSSGPLPDKALWPWILALGVRNTKRRSGLQYCPMCLSEDRTPYYRLQWRFAWHVGCEHHHCSLLDRCPHCNAPIEPHRLHAEDGCVAVCATCKGELRDVGTAPCSDDALAFQLAGDEVVRSGGGQFMAHPVETDAWFAGTSFFSTLLRRANRSDAEALHAFLDRMGVVVPDLPLNPGTVVELLRTEDRQPLLGALRKMIGIDLGDVTTYLNESGITRQGFVAQGEKMPALFAEIFTQLPDNAGGHRKRIVRDPGQPRPRHEVMRMWLRLQRKLEMQQR